MNQKLELRNRVFDLFNFDSFESNAEDLLDEHKINSNVNVFAFPSKIALGSINSQVLITKTHYIAFIKCLENAFKLLSQEKSEEGVLIEDLLKYKVTHINEQTFEFVLSAKSCDVLISSNYQELKKLGNGVKKAILTSLIQDFEIELGFKKVLTRCVNEKKTSVLIDALKAWAENHEYELVFALARFAYPVSHAKYDKFSRILVKEAAIYLALFDFFFTYIKRV